MPHAYNPSTQEAEAEAGGSLLAPSSGNLLVGTGWGEGRVCMVGFCGDHLMMCVGADRGMQTFLPLYCVPAHGSC